METLINSLPSSLAESHEIILNLQQELAREKLKNTYLLEQFRLAKQARFSPSSEKNIHQGDFFDEAGIESEADERKQTASVEVKSHQRKKHPVRKPLPADLPREQIHHDLNEEEKICPCGSCLSRMGEEITEQLKFIPASLSVIQHIRYKYACKPCQGTVRIAPMPIMLLPKTYATPELIAHTIVSKYTNHIPLYRQSKIWERVDIDLPRSTLCSWLMNVAELCSPLVVAAHKILLSENYIQADESPIQVLAEPSRKNTSKSYMWVYRGGGIVIFDYQETRSGYHAENFLQDFKGFLQTDAYSGYIFAHKNKGIIPVGCMVHARRPFAQLAKLSRKEGLATKALSYFKALYTIESYARDNQLNSEERFNLRNEKVPPILGEFKMWLTAHLPKLPKQHQMGKAVNYVLNHWSSLINYLKDGQLEIDNNKVENLIRPLALGRKNFLFMGSPQGAKAGAIYYSLIAMCIENKIEPYQYFCAMLNKIKHCKNEDDYRALLPQHIIFN